MAKQLRKFTQTVSEDVWDWLVKRQKQSGATSVSEVVRAIIADYKQNESVAPFHSVTNPLLEPVKERNWNK